MGARLDRLLRKTARKHPLPFMQLPMNGNDTVVYQQWYVRVVVTCSSCLQGLMMTGYLDGSHLMVCVLVVVHSYRYRVPLMMRVVNGECFQL